MAITDLDFDPPFDINATDFLDLARQLAAWSWRNRVNRKSPYIAPLVSIV